MMRYVLPMLVLAGTILALLVGVRFVPKDLHLAADDLQADHFMQHFYDPETNEHGTFRWSGPLAALVVNPSWDWQSPAILQLRLASPRPPGASPSLIHLESGAWHSGSFIVRAEWRCYQVLVNIDETHQIRLKAARFTPGAGDLRSLGVALSDFRLVAPSVSAWSPRLFLKLIPGVPLPVLAYGVTCLLIGRFTSRRRLRSLPNLAPYQTGEITLYRNPSSPLLHEKMKGSGWIGWLDRLKRGALFSAAEWGGLAVAGGVLLFLTVVVASPGTLWLSVLAGAYLLLAVAALVLVWHTSFKWMLLHAMVGGIGSIGFAWVWSQWVGAPFPLPGGYASVALGVVGVSWGVAAMLRWRYGVSFVLLLRRDRWTFAPLIVVLILHGVLLLFPALAFQTMPVWLFFLGLSLAWAGWWGFLVHRRALEGPFIRRFEYVAVPMLVSLALAYAAYHADIRSNGYNQAVLVLVAGAVVALKAWQAAELVGESEPERSRGMLSERGGLVLAAVLAGASVVLVAAISVARHLNFQTAFYDLGVFEEAIYCVSFGDWPRLREHMAQFCMHVSPILLLTVPFYLLAGQEPWVLLVIQAIAMAGGSVLVYLLGRHETGHTAFGLAVAAAYVLLPPFHWVCQLDFHEVAFVPPLVIGSIYALRTRRLTGYWIGMVLLLLVKEELALTVVAVGGYVLLWTRYRVTGLVTIAAGMLWFLVAMKVIIPNMYLYHSAGNPYLAGHYSELGGSLEAIVHTLVAHPQRVFEVVAIQKKFENLVYLFLPVGWLVLAAGPVVVGAGPAFAMLFLANPESAVSQLTGFQYGATLLPWIMIGVIFGVARVLPVLSPSYRHRWLTAVAAFILGCALVSSYLFAPLPWGRQRDWTMLQVNYERLHAFNQVIAAVPPHSYLLISPHIGAHVSGQYEVTMSFGERLMLRVPEPEHIPPQVTHIVLDIHDTERPGLVALLTPDSPFGVLAWEGDFAALERGYSTRHNGMFADYLESLPE
ncbi:MAG: DUF2079 domain-containing protein [Chloroflexaceae bacterium]|nr:DUF2079 domain-containing protein [Chloroflexaceae bacterium]